LYDNDKDLFNNELQKQANKRQNSKPSPQPQKNDPFDDDIKSHRSVHSPTKSNTARSQKSLKKLTIEGN
jgi:hypothetical protein